MPTLKLEMTFKNEDGKSNKISVYDARNDLTELEVNTAMDAILTKNIFAPGGSNLVEKMKAELVSTDVTTFAMA